MVETVNLTRFSKSGCWKVGAQPASTSPAPPKYGKIIFSDWQHWLISTESRSRFRLQDFASRQLVTVVL